MCYIDIENNEILIDIIVIDGHPTRVIHVWIRARTFLSIREFAPHDLWQLLKA